MKSPEFKATAFDCPLCHAYAQMKWMRLRNDRPSSQNLTPLHQAVCTHCKDFSVWFASQEETGETTGEMILPPERSSPPAHVEMPQSVRTDYDEAQAVLSGSARSSAALLRLAVQRLMVELGLPGKNINDDIGALVKQGLPIEIQQALDVVRVVGNNAVHPGELSADDVGLVADRLFELINLIVEDRISRPRKLKKMYEALPPGALDAIKKRDGGQENGA